MPIPTELRGRVVATTGFDYTSTIFLLADDSNIDVVLRVYAPGLAADDFNKLCLAIGDRLRAALVGLNDEMIVEIHHDDEFNHVRVVINNPEYMNSSLVAGIVLATAKAIVQASEFATYRRVITLKGWECAVLVDWDEPFSTTLRQFTVTVPTEGTGLGNSDRHDLLMKRIDALCGPSVSVSAMKLTGGMQISLWSLRPAGITPVVAREHIERILFAIGTAVLLTGINCVPVVELSRPFTPFVDDGSEPTNSYKEY